MSRAVAYSAAEYFIDALKKSATFNIDFSRINLLLEHASQDVNSYFKKEGKNDVLFIVKEFPDIFMLNGSNITLTDAFIALYAFPESGEFCPTYKCHNVFETSVIEYIKLILVRCGMCNYLKLFNVLLTQNNLLANHFSDYTKEDMYAFFQKYTSTFTIINDNVCLNRSAPTNFKTFNNYFCEKSLEKLTKTTCFLLTCFDSLHYIELRQVISFVISDVMDYLNTYSLIKQREIFENLPDTAMDKMGYVSLKNFESLVPSSKELRLVLLIVCILAFKSEIHFLKISELIPKRVSSEVSSIFCDLPISEQFKYFRKLSDYFCINRQGYVTLLPSFIFPSCTFDSSLSNFQTNYIGLQPSTFTAQSNDVTPNIAPNHNSNLRNGIIGAIVLPENLSLKNSSNNSVKSPAFQNCKTSKKNFSSLKRSGCQMTVRLKLSMIFLMESIQAPICKSVLKSCFFVLNDVQAAFLKLPVVQQINYIKECEIYFDSLLKKGLLPGVPSMSCINDSERVLLFIVYVLLNEKIMLCEKLSWQLDSRKIDSAFSKLSKFDKLVYFKKLSDYLTISVNDNVSLKKSFDSINTLIDSHYDILQRLSLDSENATVMNNECFPLQKEKYKKKSSNESFVQDILSSATEVLFNELNMPLNIYKKLQLSIIWLQKWFDILCTEDILQAFLYSVNDLQTYFLKLSTAEQEKFISNYFRYTSSKSFNEMSLKDSQLTEDEKALLATTYLLIQSKTLHYEKIVKELKALKISASLCSAKTKQQYKAFKGLNKYFDIRGNGQVLFSSSYYFLMSIVNPILMNLKFKKYITETDSNNIVHNCKGNFVCENAECIVCKNVSSESVTSQKNKPTNDSLKHPCFSRRPTIRAEFLRRIGNSLITPKSTNIIAPQNNTLKMKPSKISQTVKNKFLNFSIETSESTMIPNSVSDTSQAVNNKHRTENRDSSVSHSYLQLKTYERTVANSKPSLSYETKNISKEIKCDHVLNRNNAVIESGIAKINSMARNCDRSHDYKLKQNLNSSFMHDNTFHQSTIEDSDNKGVFSSDDDLDPYTLYGLELLNSFLGESVPHTSSCTNHDFKNQNFPTSCKYDCPIKNQKVANASSSNSVGALKDNIKTNDQFLCKSIPSKSNIPLKQLPDFDIVEIQAVKFFSVILGNYESGVSADILMKHLNLASEKVKNFMLGSFQSDVISFFMRHEAVFYVSPATKHIYLAKNKLDFL